MMITFTKLFVNTRINGVLVLLVFPSDPWSLHGEVTSVILGESLVDVMALVFPVQKMNLAF
jgi:hypothetical protein